MANLYDRFFERFAHRLAEPFITHPDGGMIRYADLHAATGRIANLFASLGIKAPDGHLTGWAAVLSVSSRYIIAFACVVLVTGLLYYFGPYRSMKLRNVWPGAFLATALWALATTGFGWYVRNLANYNVMYGSIAAVIVMLVWMYLLAIICLFGCEFNAEMERLRAT